MDKPVFDAASFVDINLETGAISSPVNDRLALVPTQLLKALQPGDTLTHAAATWGSQHGQRLADHLALDPDGVGMEVLSSFLSGTIAALGMGRLSIEIRCDALVFRKKGTGSDGETLSGGESELLEGFLAGYLNALGEQAFAVLHMGEESGDQLFFAGNPMVVEGVRQLSIQNQERLAAIEKLISRSH